MGASTAISWTEATWNPVTGCTKISSGCDHCYAETIANRFGPPAYPAGFQVTLRPERLDLPLRWTTPRVVFVNSMSDLFHADIPTAYVARVFAVMGLATHHTFQVLTKRPARMRSLLTSLSFQNAVHRAARDLAPSVRNRSIRDRATAAASTGQPILPWPIPNVWLGVTVENQKTTARIPILQDTPARLRFLSCEPLLEHVLLCRCDGADVEVRRHPFLAAGNCPLHGDTKLDWVIAGGESGSGARLMDPDWVRSLHHQCRVTGVAFHFKQAGAVLARVWGCTGKGSTPSEWPEPFPQEYPGDVALGG